MILDIKEDGICLDPEIFGGSASISRYIESSSSNASTNTSSYTTLKDFLNKPKPTGVVARLILVEDLSPAMIELLGSTLDLNPSFFAGHLTGTENTVGADHRNDKEASHYNSDYGMTSVQRKASGIAKLDNCFSSSWKRSARIIRNSLWCGKEALCENLYRPCEYLERTENMENCVGMVEERISFLHKTDDHGWTGWLFYILKLPPLAKDEY